MNFLAERLVCGSQKNSYEKYKRVWFSSCTPKLNSSSYDALTINVKPENTN